MSFQAATFDAEAGGLRAATDAYRSEHAGLISGGGGGTDYLGIPGMIPKLESARQTALQMDEAKSRTFWSEMGEFMDHGINYWADKARFEAEVEALVEGARDALERLKTAIEPAKEHLGVPRKLAGQRRQWKGVQEDLQDPGKRVPTLKAIDGWTGAAAETYGTMTDVQTKAVEEYLPMARAMWDTLLAATEYNEAVLTAVYGALSGALGTANRCVPGGDKEFYVNTANFKSAVEQAILEVQRASTMAEAPSEQLASSVEAQASSPVIIGDGWPTGTSQAGAAAQQGAGVAGGQVPDEVELDVCLAPSHGVQR